MKRIVLGLLVAALAAGAGIAAARDLKITEGAYELAFNAVAFPRNAAGTASFTTCEGCSTVALQVTPRTEYRVNGETLSLADFLAATERVKSSGQAGGALVTVYYDLETKRITKIAVFAGSR